MSRIAYAWEFGANLGHVGTFLPIARDLRARGHEVRWMVAHAGQAARLLDKEGFAWLQAPGIPEIAHKTPPQSYADILLRFGYASAEDLFGLAVAWRELLILTAPGVLLADHAPTAILAARTLGIPVMLFGSGFFVPPQVSPMPNMRSWVDVPADTLTRIEEAVLASVNSVLCRFAKKPLDRLAELFRVEETALLAFPELDHYPQRGPAAYWGMLPAAVADPPVWPSAAGPRVYAYLRMSSPHCEAALQALGNLRSACLVYCPDIPQAQRDRYSSANLHFADTPVDLNRTAHEADAAVTYASPAATVAFLLAGKPVLMLPGHLEQYLFALRVEELGAGLLVHPEQAPDDLPQKLQRVLSEPAFAANAAAFAKKYASFNQAEVQANIVSRIEGLAQSAAEKGSS